MYKELTLLIVLLALSSALPTGQIKIYPDVNQAETLVPAQTKFTGGNWKHNFGLGNYGGGYSGYAAVPVVPGYASYYGNGYNNGYGWKFG